MHLILNQNNSEQNVVHGANRDIQFYTGSPADVPNGEERVLLGLFLSHFKF